MKKKAAEETILLLSTVKWLILATAVGVIVGASTAVFVKSLDWGYSLSGHYRYFYLTLPFGLLLSAIIIKYLFPTAKGHGADRVINDVHNNASRVNPLMVPVEFVRTLITISAGGSAGKEGPSIQIGAGLASIFAGIIRLNETDRRKLVICGISAGFASVFGTPLAGAIFGIEVILIGSIMYDVLLPSFMACIISYQVSSWLGLNYFYHPIKIAAFEGGFFIKIIIAGVCFGLVSFMLVEVLKLGRWAAEKMRIADELKGIIGGCIIVALTFLFSKDYLGLGVETIQSALNGGAIAPYGFFIKSITTSITLAFGGSGGISTPIFFIGSTAGATLSALLNIDAATLSAIGFVAILAGAANTPIAASIMAVEMFGADIAPYAAIACIISYVITGHRSVYVSQVLITKKSNSIDVETNEKIGEAKARHKKKG